MKHLVFNVVVIGALAFIFLKDGDVELPFDFHSGSPAQTAPVEKAKSPSEVAFAGAVSKDEFAARETPNLDMTPEVVPVEISDPKVTASAKSNREEISEPVVASQQPETLIAEQGTVEPEVARASSVESSVAEDVLPPLEPAVTVSAPVVNTAPTPGHGEEKLPQAVSISVAAAESAKPETSFMSPRERRRELNRMIEELETFYLGKFTR